jgi:hypothetical protein
LKVKKGVEDVETRVGPVAVVARTAPDATRDMPTEEAAEVAEEGRVVPMVEVKMLDVDRTF